MDELFKGKGALILGGSSSIGMALALHLLGAGMKVYVTYGSPEGKQKVCLLVEKGAIGVSLNLGREEEIYSFFKKEREPISYLIDLAHTHREGLFASLKDEEIRDYYSTNLVGRALFLKYMVREMLLLRWGRMIYLSSSAVSFINPGQSLYASSKAAVEALYKTIGIEMQGRGISTLILRCGYVNAGRGREFLKTHTPLKSFALESQEVAEAILFFLSKQGQAFCSTEITLDRGFGSMLKKMATGGR